MSVVLVFIAVTPPIVMLGLRHLIQRSGQDVSDFPQILFIALFASATALFVGAIYAVMIARGFKRNPLAVINKNGDVQGSLAKYRYSTNQDTVTLTKVLYRSDYSGSVRCSSAFAIAFADRESLENKRLIVAMHAGKRSARRIADLIARFTQLPVIETETYIIHSGKLENTATINK